MTRVTLVDVTLRDGSHTVRHQFTAEQVTAVTRGLVSAGVEVIEVSHGDGLGGSSLTYGRSLVDEMELIGAAVREAAGTSVRIAVLLLPGIGTVDELEEAWERGARVVRVATHATEADIAIDHIGKAREIGFETFGFLMMAHMVTPAELAEQAKIQEAAGATAVYCTDSAGALTPRSAAERVGALRRALAPSTRVGFHAHNNLGLAVGNTIAAIEHGAALIDAATRGVGAGAGNCATEAIAAAADKLGIDLGISVPAIADVAEEVVSEAVPRRPALDRASLMLGWAGVYSSFLLHAEAAARRYDVATAEILVELGRLGVVGGQEDMIIDVAVRLAERGQRTTMTTGAIGATVAACASTETNGERGDRMPETAGTPAPASGQPNAPSPRVLFARVTTAASLQPWFGDFVEALGDACEVRLYDPAQPLGDQFDGVRAVVDLGGFADHDLIDAGRYAGVELWHVLGYGLDHIDIEYVHASGIPLAHTPGNCTAVPLAEHVFHLMLSLEKRFRASQQVLESGQYGGPFSGELAGQTLGVIGFGASGRALARRAHAFGMRVVAIDAVPPAPGDPDAETCEYLGDLANLGELLRTSDYVSLHLPLTEQTHHVLDASAIAQMKPTAAVLNVARGALIDTAALVDALAAGTLRGAGLDVFEDEPLPPDHPLAGIEDVVLTPHVAGLTRETSRRRGHFAAANILRLVNGDGAIEGLVP